MAIKSKSIVKLSFILLLTGGLLYISFSSIQVVEGESRWNFILKTWQRADKGFLLLSALAAIISHLIRAERWKLLLRPIGYNLSLLYSFYSVMVGYFINLVIPRGGEISRCYNLFKLNKTPINISFGTVIAERAVDLVILLLLILTSFFVEIEKFTYFFNNLSLNNSSKGGGFIWLFYVAGFFVLLFAMFVLFVRKRQRWALKIVVKLKQFLSGLKKGLYAVLHLKQKKQFIAYSITIWALYYLMSYFVILAFPETGILSYQEALTIFVIGGIAMTIPLPGGLGSYHILVPAGLSLLYGIHRDDAVAFTFIFHGWQTLLVIIIGSFSLIISQFLYKSHKNV